MRPGAAARLAAALAAVAVAATGCSAGVDDGSAQQAAAAARTFLRLCADDRGEDVVDLLALPARKPFIDGAGTGDGCARVLAVPPAPLDGARVGAVRVTGAFADVEVVLPGGSKATLEAERRGDRWLVTNRAFGV